MPAGTSFRHGAGEKVWGAMQVLGIVRCLSIIKKNHSGRDGLRGDWAQHR